jgi:hypothetical protein
VDQVIVFFASIFGAGFPVVAKKVKWMKIPPKVFFFCKHFGTGVLIATAFVHVSVFSADCSGYNLANMSSSCLLHLHPSMTHACQICSRMIILHCLV